MNDIVKNEEVTFREVCGYILEERDGEIIAVNCNLGFHAENRLELYQVVEASQNTFVPEGTKGRITGFVEPYSHGFSSDIIQVVFESKKKNNKGKRPPMYMKYKDIKYKNLKS